MSTAVSPVPVLEAMPPREAARQAEVPVPPPVSSAAEPTYRLIIEETGPNSYVYKTIDRDTGEVVRQFPREEVLRMMADEGYAPGDVIETEA